MALLAQVQITNEGNLGQGWFRTGGGMFWNAAVHCCTANKTHGDAEGQGTRAKK